MHHRHDLGRVVTTVLAALACACSERPAECTADALAALQALSAESAGALAPRSIDEAKIEVARTDAHVRGQQARWRWFRRWDAELCGKGAAALAQARADVAAARAARDQALALDQAAAARLGEAGQRLDRLAAFLDAGVVGPDLAERIGNSRGALAGAQGKLALTLGELRGAGFLGPLEPLQRVAREVDDAARELADVATAASGAAVARCRPRLGAATPSFSGEPRVLSEWMAWRGTAGPRQALFAFRLDRDRRACRQVAARADDDALSPSVDGDVRVWRTRGRLPTAILAGWTATGAWFVPSAGGMLAFTHDRAARFVGGCLGKVSCDKPEFGDTTVEAMCTCAYGDLDLAIGDRSRRVRYVWDGRTVRAEQ